MNNYLFNSIFNTLKPVQNSDELYWLISHIENLNPYPQVIIEIGVENGGTFKYWEQILEAPTSPNEKVLIGIDTVNNIKWDISQSKCNIHIINDDSTKKSTIDKVKTILNDTQADFLFIDGGHAEEIVTADFYNYKQFVRKDGLIAFHDINDLIGVKQFWDKLYEPKQTYTSKNNGIGIGLLCKQ